MHKVRETVKYGADVIKFCASGGVFSKGDDPLLEQYSPQEMQALIAEAHRLGRKVATHAHSALSIKDAVRADVDSVEHGIFLDEEGIQLLKEHKTFLVPTTYPLFWFEEHAPRMNLPPWVKEKAAIIIPAAKKNVSNAFRNGVEVALGYRRGQCIRTARMAENSGPWCAGPNAHPGITSGHDQRRKSSRVVGPRRARLLKESSRISSGSLVIRSQT